MERLRGRGAVYRCGASDRAAIVDYTMVRESLLGIMTLVELFDMPLGELELELEDGGRIRIPVDIAKVFGSEHYVFVQLAESPSP